MPIVRNVIKPQNKHKNPTGSKKKFSCKIPCVSIYSTDTAFRKIQAIPKQRKIPPMAIEIRFIFALLVSLEFVINVNELPFFSKQELLATLLFRANTACNAQKIPRAIIRYAWKYYNCFQFEKGRVTVYWLLLKMKKQD